MGAISWTSPKTYTVSEIVTAAMLNTYQRDNLLDLDARTTWHVDVVSTSQNTTSTSYTDLATVGPSLTITSGIKLIVVVTARAWSNANDEGCQMGFDISGATTIAASDSRGLRVHSSTSGGDVDQQSALFVVPVNAGANTIVCKYKSTDGASPANFSQRQLVAVPGGAL